MPPRRDLERADQAARTMFNVFPQGVGERVSGGAQALAGAAMGAINRFANPFGALASDVSAARQAVSGTTLLGRRGPSQEVATAPTPVLPSGTPMTGFDIYPTQPQMTPRTAVATAPQPSAPSLTAATVPTFPTTGMGIMGNENIRPIPTEQLSPMTGFAPTLADRGGVNVNIAGVQRNPQIQTPYGTIYATPEQAANMNRPRTIAQQSTRSPAEQQALLAQMRERGSAIGQRIGGQQEAYFTQKRAEMAELNRATAQAAQAGMSPQSIREARSVYTSQQPSSIGGIQQQFASFLNTPSFGETPMANRTAFVRAPFGIPSGGPQPAQMQTMAAAPQLSSAGAGLNTTQRSWDNYVGPNPIESRVGTPFYDRSPRYGRRA